MNRRSSRNCINNLPNDVMSIILSRLPLKEVVRTSVLSKDWKFKWTYISDVDIDIEKFSPESRNETTFVTIAEKVLRNILGVRKCSLMCICSIEQELSRFSVVVSGVLRRKVKRFVVDICNSQGFVLPCSILTCATLTKLHSSFEAFCSIRVPINYGLPNLKFLTLSNVNIRNDISNTDTLFFNFPVLKLLELLACNWVGVELVEIDAPSLCNVTSITPFEWDEDTKNFDYSIKIIGTRVVELITGGGYPENISVAGSAIVKANLKGIDDSPLSAEECGLRVRRILRELPNLSCLSIMDIRPIGWIEQGLPLPRFIDLKRMKLGTVFDANVFLELLHAAPFLTSLEIHVNYRYQSDYDSVESVPHCVLHHLEEVSFHYESDESNYLVERFLLKHGATLKTVFVSCPGKYSGKMEGKLSTLPRASSCIKIKGRCSSTLRSQYPGLEEEYPF